MKKTASDKNIVSVIKTTHRYICGNRFNLAEWAKPTRNDPSALRPLGLSRAGNLESTKTQSKIHYCYSKIKMKLSCSAKDMRCHAIPLGASIIIFIIFLRGEEKLLESNLNINRAKIIHYITTKQF